MAVLVQGVVVEGNKLAVFVVLARPKRQKKSPVCIETVNLIQQPIQRIRDDGHNLRGSDSDVAGPCIAYGAMLSMAVVAQLTTLGMPSSRVSVDSPQLALESSVR